MKLRKYVLVAATIVLAVSLVRPVYAHFIQELECRQVYFDLSAESAGGRQVECAVGKGDRHLHIAAAQFSENPKKTVKTPGSTEADSDYVNRSWSGVLHSVINEVSS
jgi:hypothetical protein